jgi:hypothetical protein
MKRAIFALAVLLALATAVLQAQTITPLAVLNCTSTNFPSCGWGHWGNNPHHTLTRVGNGARFTLTPGSATQLTQFYMGWGTNIPQATLGQSRFIRLRLRVIGPVNPAGVEDVWTDKFIILGDNGDTPGRVIIELRPTLQDNALETRIQKNIAGDEARTPLLTLPIDQTVSLQYEARSGSNGRVAVWMNNNNFATPTRVSPTFNLEALAWNNIRVGFYSNASLASNGRITFEVTDVVIDDAFDPNWHGSQPPPSSAPAPPTALRLQ